jgi:glycine/D-amino acid oxidase-like deaminating enzyme
VVICGAGIAGIAAAYFLAVHQGIRDVLLVDQRPPLTLTSDKSTEAYRDWWPGPGPEMVAFMSRSIDLLEELADASDNVFRMNRRGYVYLTATADRARRLQESAQAIADLGAGRLRIHPGDEEYQPHSAEAYRGQPAGADLLLGSELIRRHFPFLSAEAAAALHTRRCGWLSAQQLGIYLLDCARDAGVRFLSGSVCQVLTTSGRVTGVQVDDAHISTPVFINAAGPYLGHVGRLMGVDLPVFNELHGKIAFSDVQGYVPRNAPMMIWDEPLELPWSAEEREELAADEETRWLLRPLPAGLHFRPEGGEGSPILLMLWPYHTQVLEPIWPPPAMDDFFVEVVLRGLSRMIPALARYLERRVRPAIDCGYYCKTIENRPLIGPMPVEGAYVIGALSGYGIMAAPAAGELLAAHVAGSALPAYAPAFLLSRYEEPAYQQQLASWGDTGQL